MKQKVNFLPPTPRHLKKFSKKYPSFKEDLGKEINRIIENPNLATSLGNGFFKSRIQVSSKSKGKSGGIRIIFKVKNDELFIYAIYDKSSTADVRVEDLCCS